MIQLTFVGTGEAVDPELPNTSLLYNGGRRVLLDCGYSVPQALWQVSRDPSLLDAIFISHAHADHCFGLPPLLLWMHEAGRSEPLAIIGAAGVGAWLESLFDTAYPGLLERRGAFEVDLLEAAPGLRHALGPVTLTTAQSQHSIDNLSIRLEEAGRAVCYSGDGAPTDATVALYRGAGTLVHECYGAEPMTETHADLATLLDVAQENQIATLCLLHLARDQKLAIRDLVDRYDGPVEARIPEPGETMRLV